MDDKLQKLAALVQAGAASDTRTLASEASELTNCLLEDGVSPEAILDHLEQVFDAVELQLGPRIVLEAIVSRLLQGVESPSATKTVCIGNGKDLSALFAIARLRLSGCEVINLCQRRIDPEDYQEAIATALLKAPARLSPNNFIAIYLYRDASIIPELLTQLSQANLPKVMLLANPKAPGAKDYEKLVDRLVNPHDLKNVISCLPAAA